jgi:hypothetical protein
LVLGFVWLSGVRKPGKHTPTGKFEGHMVPQFSRERFPNPCVRLVAGEGKPGDV